MLLVTDVTFLTLRASCIKEELILLVKKQLILSVIIYINLTMRKKEKLIESC